MARKPSTALARDVVRLLSEREATPAPKVIEAHVAPPLSLRERFLAFDDDLSAKGLKPLTTWWREGIGRWLDAYEQHRVLELTACVGRGAAKSTALVKLACFFAVECDALFDVPPGERHYAVVLSLRKSEAKKGLRLASHIFELRGVPATRRGDAVEIDTSRKGIIVVAATVEGATGWRAFFVGKDERSKWKRSTLTEREADEVDTSATAMTATHPLAPVLSFGSAWTADGDFYESVRAGTTDARVVLGPAPTWVAAPHITEESTRRKEKNPAKWRREYASVFTEGNEEGMLTAAMLDAVTRAGEGDVPREKGVTYVAAQDVGFVKNAWTFCIAALRRVGGRMRRSIVLAREWQGNDDAPLNPERMLEEMAGYCRAYGVQVVESDQYERFSLQTIARRVGLTLSIYARPPVTARFSALLTWLVDGDVELPAHPAVRRDLLAIRQRFTATGYTVHLPVTADGRHCDFAPTVYLALSSCVMPPDESVLMTEDERIERDAVEMDERQFAARSADPLRRGRSEPKQGPAYWQRDPLSGGTAMLPADALGRHRRR